MITITHTRFSPNHEAWVTSGPEDYSSDKHRYALGYRPPNYPVPATAGTAALSIYHQDGMPVTIWPHKMVKAELNYLK